MSISSPSFAVSAVTPVCTRLANGLQVAVLSQAGSTQAAISVRVAAGSHDEPAAHPGLAHFLEHLLFLDCADYRGEQRLMPFVQACGGQLNASTQAAAIASLGVGRTAMKKFTDDDGRPL